MHKEEGGKNRSRVPGQMRFIIETVAILPRGSTERELGRPEFPQGAEFIQGPLPASLSTPTGSGADGRAVALVGPQQHDDPRQCARHLQ